MKTNFRSLVMKMAHALRDRLNSWSECLKRAWRAYKLRQAMREGIVNFTFRKVDGTIRYAKGTIKPAESKGSRKPNYGTVIFFDTLIEEYRCFKIENLLKIY